MTPLIDVIFLLLLFFMLTSTFSKYSEVELTAAASGTMQASAPPPLFLQLGEAEVSLNAQALSLATLPAAIRARSRGTAEAGQTLLVSMAPEVSAQRLTDLLVTLRGVTNLSIAVLGSGP